MKDYFEFYDIEQRFLLDEKKLKAAYLANNKQYHPDRHVLSDAATQAEAMELSLENNIAYKTLSDFDKRILHLLQLKGIVVDTEKGNTLPQSFLMEMMDINEKLMEVQMDPDESTITSLHTDIESLIEAEQTELMASLEQYDAEKKEDILQKIKDHYFKRKYMLRIQNNLDKFAQP